MNSAEQTHSNVEEPSQETGGALVFQSGKWAMAIDLGLVERITSREELRKVKIERQPKIATGFNGVVRSGKTHYLLWDIGELLGQGSERDSVVLLRLKTVAGDTLPIALRAGRCLTVGKLPNRGMSALPSRLTQKR